MITDFDDFCIHQTTEPVVQPSPSDRNFYDRYWFNGFDAGGDWMFEVGLGLYPNRRVMDGHFGVSAGNRQVAFHASRRAPKERGDTAIGPLSIEVVSPLRQVRVRLAANEHNIECDLVFTAASVPHEEPQNVLYDDGHLIMHNSRFTQLGYWDGYYVIDGERFEVRRACATRDRSWGIRPVGEPQGGAPGLMNDDPGVYWVWCPIHFGDVCTQFATFEDRDGHPTQLSADLLPLYPTPDAIPRLREPGLVSMQQISHRLQWVSGTRRAGGGELHFVDREQRRYDIALESRQPFYMLGIGYGHAEWGHGIWKGELETGREQWDLDAIDPLQLPFIHTHQVVRATMGDRVGTGTLETLCIGRHAPSEFTDFFDGAP